jgi:hypothetical protein
MNYCVACGNEMPEESGSMTCKFCQLQAKYDLMRCPECGEWLEVWAEYPNRSYRENSVDWGYQSIDLIRHCGHCHRDWQNTCFIEHGRQTETALKQKFWG